jgi:Tol biopolymer transport system component
LVVSGRRHARIFSRRRQRHVSGVALGPDGSNARSITSRGSYGQPFWSPDGRSIAVSAKIDEPHYRIYIMGANGADLRAIRQPEGVDNVHPAWSPDGRSIVFTSGIDAAASLQVFDIA